MHMNSFTRYYVVNAALCLELRFQWNTTGSTDVDLDPLFTK